MKFGINMNIVINLQTLEFTCLHQLKFCNLLGVTFNFFRMKGNEGTYGVWTASSLIFNLVVGMGIWTLPKMIYETGTVAAYSILLFSGFLSYIVATYINELQSNTNAIKKLNLSTKV